MRLLLIHSDSMEYEAREKTRIAEECSLLVDGMQEALTVFTAVEEGDADGVEDVVHQAVSEIVETADRVGTKNILLYPYAHLSNDLAAPEVAIKVLTLIEHGPQRPRGVHGEAGSVRLVQVVLAPVQGPPALRALQDDRPLRRRGGRRAGEARGRARLLRDDPGRGRARGRRVPGRLGLRLPGQEGARRGRAHRRRPDPRGADAVEGARRLRARLGHRQPPVAPARQARARPARGLRARAGPRVRRLAGRDPGHVRPGRPGDLRARGQVRRAPVPVPLGQPVHDAPLRGLLRHVLDHAGHAHLAEHPPHEDVRALDLLVPARAARRGDRAQAPPGLHHARHAHPLPRHRRGA